MADQVSGLKELFDKRLPVNRKERYYTGTVLPMIVASDGFKRLPKFLTLCGVTTDLALEDHPASTNVQFFTEYGFQESRKDGAQDRFGNPAGNDTPDLVVYVEGTRSLLLGIEAKMFSRPSAGAIRRQLKRQKGLLKVMADGVGTDPCLLQVALLPRGLDVKEEQLDACILHWETIAETFANDGPSYWIRTLQEAATRYPRLMSPAGSGLNADNKIDGLTLRYGNTNYTWMGRTGGIRGAALKNDIETGQWKSQKYEVRTDPLPENRNWFPIADFIEKIEKARFPISGPTEAN